MDEPSKRILYVQSTGTENAAGGGRAPAAGGRRPGR